MIEINLLPESLRKKKKAFQMPEITLASPSILIGIAVSLILIHIMLLITVKVNKGAYEKMTKESEEIIPQKESIELTKRENAKTRKRVEAIESLMTKKILWSKKLNQLSNLIIPGVWYTRLSINKKTVVVEAKQRGKTKKSGFGVKKLVTERIELPYLNIDGEVSSAYGEPVAIIGRLIEQLKSDPEFFKDFSNIELNSTELHSIEDVEVMKFNINCYFKKVVKR